MLDELLWVLDHRDNYIDRDPDLGGVWHRYLVAFYGD
jgi:hypothetical protein